MLSRVTDMAVNEIETRQQDDRGRDGGRQDELQGE
jgi:hypothetical protein